MAQKPSDGTAPRRKSREPVLPSVNPAAPDPLSPEDSLPFSIVAVGASAGGIEAFQNFLAALPTDTGMAFVLILHLDPNHQSALAEILSRATSMTVREIQNDMPVEANHVYVMPPGKNMVFSHGRLHLSPRTEIRGLHHPIDHFMRSIAEEQGHKAIGVVLSGTGSDGTLGVQEIKAAGGIAFAQDGTAQQTLMPTNAVASGAIDLVLPPEGIAQELARIGRHPFVRPQGRQPPRELPADQPDIERVLKLLKQETGMDFAHYRRNTLQRRIARRMVLHKLDDVHGYADLVEKDSRELDALYHDVLINVTSFFRDPEAFEALKKVAFPRLTENQPRRDQVRVWTLGCSTGEEAYSLAMAYTEYAEETGQRTAMQVFATDVNAAGIEKARAGVYTRGIEQDVTPERLRRFFTEVDGSYRIAKPIRDMCLFARHNGLADPPFSRIDFIACRNLLIYLEPVLQQRLFPILHYALRPEGMLWLGGSETASAFGELFEPLDSKHRIYVRKQSVRFRAIPRAPRQLREPVRLVEKSFAPLEFEPDPQVQADRVLLDRYAPPGVVLDNDLNVVQFRGDTSPYLMPPQGRASLNLIKMLREGLLAGVRDAVRRAQRERQTVREEGLRAKGEAGSRRVNVVAMPLYADGKDAGIVVLFEAPGEGSAANARQSTAESRAKKASRQAPESSREEAQRLRQELGATRDYLQSVIEQLETANAELQAANEESQSSNEELQSVNEELETSREEIQSANEELSTVNDELNTSNVELAQSNMDLANLLASVQMPIVMLDWDLCIRRFTPSAGKVLNLLPADVGRPITDIKLPLDAPDIDEILGQVLQHGGVFEREVKDRHDRWQWLRIRPYRTPENKVQGALVMVIDIDALKRSGERLRESETRFEALADSAPVLMWVHGLDGGQFVNRAYEEFIGIPGSGLQKMEWAKYLHPDDREAYLAAYRDAFRRHAPFEAISRFHRADGTYRWMKSVAAPRHIDGGDFSGYVGSSVDITDVKEAEERLRDADRTKDEFLGTLGHELRNPLAAISNAAYLLANASDAARESALGIIERQTRNMVRIVDDLLDVARITHGKIKLRLAPVSLEAVVRDAVSATEHERAPGDQKLEISLPAQPAWVRADAARIEQIVTNLLSNASKFAPAGGHIWLDVERDEGNAAGRAVIRVRDDGPGIDLLVLPRIFELFVQGERTDDRARMGVGIGLALARRLVEMHGGTIEARNLPEHGSEFLVRLPLCAPPAKERRETTRVDETAAAARRVLIVDDNRDAARALQILLTRQAHEVRVANDGKSALSTAREFKPHVVLLDIGLPDMDGLAVARKLREDEATCEAMLVALTGYARKEDMARTLEAGFDDHLTKPTNPEKLFKLIASAGAD